MIKIRFMIPFEELVVADLATSIFHHIVASSYDQGGVRGFLSYVKPSVF